MEDKELEEAYEEYIALLERVESSVSGYMAAHGWTQIGSDEDIKRGEELREKIARLKKQKELALQEKDAEIARAIEKLYKDGGFIADDGMTTLNNILAALKKNEVK